MTDLQIAKGNLEGHTISLCKDGQCLFSEKKGIAPLMGFIADGINLNGYSVADLVVGKAAALLMVKCKIKAVFAKTLSQSGEEVLKSHNIPYEFETLADKIINRDGTDICPMEKTVLITDDPEEGYVLLKNKIQSMKK